MTLQKFGDSKTFKMLEKISIKNNNNNNIVFNIQCVYMHPHNAIKTGFCD